MGCGTTTIKYLVFIFNLIFALGGLLLLIFGSILLWNINYYSANYETDVKTPAIALIVVGCAIFVISTFGCCGAINESHCMMITFSVLLMLLFIIQLVVGILVLVYRKQIEEVLGNVMYDLMSQYNHANYATEFWDSIQQGFHCCGIQGSDDWLNVGQPVPPSCSCAVNQPHCIGGIYQQGCYQELVSKARILLTGLGVVSIVFAVIELLGVIFACTLASAYKRKGLY